MNEIEDSAISAENDSMNNWLIWNLNCVALIYY